MNIDFVEQTLPRRRTWILASLPLALSIVLWGVQGYLQERLETQRQLRAEVELAANAKLLPATVPRAPPPYQREALAAVKRAALPEADALAELEHVEVAGIQLHTIDVNPAQSMVVVELDAATDQALADYLDQLNAGNAPAAWHIQKLAARTGDNRALAGTATRPFAEGHTVTIVRSF